MINHVSLKILRVLLFFPLNTYKINELVKSKIATPRNNARSIMQISGAILAWRISKWLNSTHIWSNSADIQAIKDSNFLLLGTTFEVWCSTCDYRSNVETASKTSGSTIPGVYYWEFDHIIELHEHSLSLHPIATFIEHDGNIMQRCIIRRIQEDVHENQRASGAHRWTSERTDWRIRQRAISPPFLTARDIRCRLLPVAEGLVSILIKCTHILYEVQLCARVAATVHSQCRVRY